MKDAGPKPQEQKQPDIDDLLGSGSANTGASGTQQKNALDFFNEIGGLNFTNNNSSAPKELQAPSTDMFNFGGNQPAVDV